MASRAHDRSNVPVLDIRVIGTVQAYSPSAYRVLDGRLRLRMRCGVAKGCLAHEVSDDQNKQHNQILVNLQAS
jgi:hypothetical protein